MPTWHQAHVAIEPWNDSDRVAAAHLAPLMTDAETAGLIDRWFFIRKSPAWRLRYNPATHAEPKAADQIGAGLDDLLQHGLISSWTGPVYEPEERAFGGEKAMDIAHGLFHADSRYLLRYVADPSAAGDIGVRRVLAVLLCAALMRGAGLDWYEQGDVWHRITEHRPLPPEADPTRLSATQSGLLTALTIDTAGMIRGRDDLACAAEWAQYFAATGEGLAQLNTAGQLHRGLREVLTHHVLFAWNRHGIPASAQAVLAHCAADAVFGPDPTAATTAGAPV